MVLTRFNAREPRYKLFNLAKTYNKNLTPADVSGLASSVLLAGLAVPPYDAATGAATDAAAELERERTLRMASILGFNVVRLIEGNMNSATSEADDSYGRVPISGLVWLLNWQMRRGADYCQQLFTRGAPRAGHEARRAQRAVAHRAAGGAAGEGHPEPGAGGGEGHPQPAGGGLQPPGAVPEAGAPRLNSLLPQGSARASA